jgi:hypothetical protein
MYRQVFMTKVAHKQERDGASRPMAHVTDKPVRLSQRQSAACAARLLSG